MRCLFALALLAFQAALPQEQPHYFVPTAGEGQILRGAPAANNGAIGMDAHKADGGFKVTGVTASGPTDLSGIKVGDLITAIDGNFLAAVGQGDFYRLIAKNPGDTIHVSYTRNGQTSQTSIPVSSRGKLYPAESNQPPGISQILFDGHATVTAAISQTPSKPESVAALIYVSNIDLPPLAVDDSKFFVLDGNGQQLRHMSLEEVKYPIQLWVAQNLRSGHYPPPTPPPPQRSYTITGMQNGNYTFTEMALPAI